MHYRLMSEPGKPGYRFQHDHYNIDVIRTTVLDKDAIVFLFWDYLAVQVSTKYVI